MKGNQDKEDGATGTVVTGGGPDGPGGQAKVKTAPKKRKAEAGKASASTTNPKKVKDAKDGGHGGSRPATAKKTAKDSNNKEGTPKSKESNKKKNNATTTQQGQQQTPQNKSKDSKKKLLGGGSTAPGGGVAEKKMKKSSDSVKKKKCIANGTAVRDDNNKRQRKEKDEAVPKEGNTIGSAVAANGWGFGTEVLTCLPRRVASLNAMAKVHIMYENETNRSTQHNNASSSMNNNNNNNNTTTTNNNNGTVDTTIVVAGNNEVVPPPPSTGSSQPTTEVDTDSDVTIEAVSTSNGHASPRVDKMLVVAVPGRCRRMASLNAQAILAASLCHDEKRPPKKKDPPPAPLTPSTLSEPPPAPPRTTLIPATATVPGGVIKIEDTEDEEKTTTVEEEEIVQIVQTTKIRRRKMKTSKSPTGGRPSPSLTPRAIKTKPLKKSEALGEDVEDLLELAAIANINKEEREQDVKVRRDLSATVTQAQQVTRTFTYSTTSTASGGLGVGGSVTPTALPPLVRPPLVISQTPAQPAIPLQNQAASFSYAATVNAQNTNPQGGQGAQMQAGTVYMTNVNMANVAAGMGNMTTVTNVTNMGSPAGYATIVTAPHFTVQQPVQSATTAFGIPTAYYQVQPLIHKPIAFHPNGTYVAGAQTAGGVGAAGGASIAGQTRTPARSIVVQVPSTRQQQQQQLSNNGNATTSTETLQVVVHPADGSASNITNQGSLSNSNKQRTGMAQKAGQVPGTGGISAQNQPQHKQRQGGVTVVKNQSGRGGVSNGGLADGGAGVSVRLPLDTSMACPLVATVGGGKRKMQGGPSGVTAPGFGSAVAKCEQGEKDNQGKERKSGLLTGIKIDTPIKSNSTSKRKFHGWSTLGEPFLKKVCTSNDQSHNVLMRVCYPLMRHSEGDEVRPRDCVLLKSGPRVIDLPFVAKVGSLWQTTEGDLMISLLWYYRPEHTEQGRRSNHMEDEIFASKHCDCSSVACIEDKCYVLTFAEYCRYRAKVKQLEEGVRSRVAAIVPPLAPTERQARLPDPGRVTADLVFFCRKVYDYRQKRILKNPTVQTFTRDSKESHDGEQKRH